MQSKEYVRATLSWFHWYLNFILVLSTRESYMPRIFWLSSMLNCPPFFVVEKATPVAYYVITFIVWSSGNWRLVSINWFWKSNYLDQRPKTVHLSHYEIKVHLFKDNWEPLPAPCSSTSDHFGNFMVTTLSTFWRERICTSHSMLLLRFSTLDHQQSPVC